MLVWPWTLLGWLYLLVPFACWAVVVRTRAIGAAVFTVLAGLAGAIVGLEREWFFVRFTAELEAGYPFVAALAILVGVLGETRLRGPRPKNRFVDPVSGAAVAICAHSVVGMVIAFAYQLVAYGSFLPSAAEVPLPPGVTLDHVDEGYCGSNFCSRTLTLRSTTGLPASEVETRVRAALAADGWTPGRGSALVHPHGWLVDRRVSEVFLGGVTVELSGSELADTRP
ncbi:hypothetical protein AB0D10_10710 [Kitasatospora sp. NPDC048545]|uniref:hypothetical protein n=1 Tax=Kitasatospora sp. NPDC048545 TaxID=3157208 RepID=UPI00340DB2DF